MRRRALRQHADHRRPAHVHCSFAVHLHSIENRRPCRFALRCNGAETGCSHRNEMNTRKLEFWILFADLVWMAGAFLAADLLRFGLTWAPDERVSIHALLPFAVVAALIWIGL